MCGIAGFLDYSKKSELKNLKQMQEILSRRGPDDRGHAFHQTPKASIGLSHTRLSIIELSHLGHQPMKHEHLEIVYNGEIYNFDEIRNELIDRGYAFKSNSDTEVLLKSYHAWGAECLDKFIGIFAFCIYDSNEQELFFARDRVGSKPLYLYWDHTLLLFSSELKSFHAIPTFKQNRKLNMEAVRLYFQYGYIPSPFSIFEKSFKLEPGHYMKIGIDNRKIQTTQYWCVFDSYSKAKRDLSFEESVEELKALLDSSFGYRMVSDVPVGIFLSGGLDSSTLAARLQSKSSKPIKTFTIGFDDKQYDESNAAKSISDYLKTEHYSLKCGFKDMIPLITQVPEIYDEPITDSSIFPTILVSSLASKHVKVVLSADGGDELFAGYSKYRYFTDYVEPFLKYPKALRKLLSICIRASANLGSFTRLRQSSKLKMWSSKISSLLDSNNKAELALSMSQIFSDVDINQIMQEFSTERMHSIRNDEAINSISDSLNVLMAHDYRYFLSDNLMTKVDRATMHHSIEGREPFLDHRIVTFAASLPRSFKLQGQLQKRILREVIDKDLPKNIANNRQKKGFDMPLQTWIANHKKEFLNSLYDRKSMQDMGLCSPDVFEQFMKNSPNDFEAAKKTWSILMLQLWANRWN